MSAKTPEVELEEESFQAEFDLLLKKMYARANELNSDLTIDLLGRTVIITPHYYYAEVNPVEEAWESSYSSCSS